MKYYVYLTTNLINGKQYVGDHMINPKEKRYYIGSGKYFCFSRKKYGVQNFFKEILEWFPTRKEAYEAQEKYIIQFNTLAPNGYNLSPKGGIGVIGCCSEETKMKMRNARLGKSPTNKGEKMAQEKKDRISNSLLAFWSSDSEKTKEVRKIISLNGQQMTGDKNSMFGKTQDPEKMKQRWVDTSHPWINRHHSEESKEAIRKKALERNKIKTIQWQTS